MKIILTTWISAIMLVFMPYFIFGNADEWTTYTTKDGLKDNETNAIAVDNQSGQVWFGTSSGVCCFDGAHWKSYLDGVKINAILVESKGNLWFGTDSGIYRKNGDNIPRLLNRIPAKTIAVDQQGIKWFGGTDGLLSTIDGTKWIDYGQAISVATRALTNEKSVTEFMERYAIDINLLRYVNTSIDSIAVDIEDRKWLAINILFKYGGYDLTIGGICIFEDGNISIIGSTAGINPITSITLNNKDNLWYSRDQKGAFFLDHSGTHHYFTQDIDGNGIWDGSQKAVAIQDIDRDGKDELVAVATAAYDQQPRGIYVYDLMSEKEKWHYLFGASVSNERVAIGDVNGDGKLEIVAGGMSPCNGSEANGSDDSHGYIFVLDANGNNIWNNGIPEPVTPLGGQVMQVALSDIDSDNVLDIVAFLGTSATVREEAELTKPGVMVADGYGNIKARFYHSSPINNGGIADLNNNGKQEIIAIDQTGLLIILDDDLTILHEQKFDSKMDRMTFVAIADLYGDDHLEILIRYETDKGTKFVILDSDWKKGTLSTIWEDSEIDDFAIISDVDIGGAPEIIICGNDHIRILGYGLTDNIPLKIPDSGWRYGQFCSLLKSAYYQYKSSIPVGIKPFKLIQEFPIEYSRYIYTADINGDGKLELISSKGNIITVWSYKNDKPEILWQRSYENERIDMSDDMITAVEYNITDTTVILANVFKEGHPRLLVIDGRNGAIIHSIVAPSGNIDQLQSNRIRKISIDRNGKIWFATPKGVSNFDGYGWHRISASNGIASDMVNDIAFDDSNNIWFATKSGITKLHNTVVGKAILNQPLNSLLADDDGSIWAGTWGDGIVRFRDEEIGHYLPEAVGAVYQITAFDIDLGRGILWAGVWDSGTDRGLWKINIETGEIEEKIEATNSDVISNNVTAIAIDHRDGSLWLGMSPNRNYNQTVRLAGISNYNPETGQFRHWSINEPDGSNKYTKNTLPIPEYTTSLLLTDSGILWIGTLDDGIRRFDTNLDGKKAWSVFSGKKYLPNDRINAIAYDKKNGMWFATPDGMSRYNQETYQWKTFTIADGLAGNFVSDAKIAENILWLATNGGVTRYDGENWTGYDRDDNLPSNSIRSIAIDRNGNPWIGTYDRYIDEYQIEHIPPDTLFTSQLDKRIGVGAVAFEYAGTDLGTRPSNLRYQYKLVTEGTKAGDVEWSKKTSETKVIYPKLSDGTYTFYVRAIDKSENADPKPAQWTFTIDTIQPTALIMEPDGRKPLTGIISIKGIAYDSDFRNYTLRWAERKSDSLDEWNIISQSDVPIAMQQAANKELGKWDTKNHNGSYTVELLVTDQLGHTSTDKVNLEIDNSISKALIRYIIGCVEFMDNNTGIWKLCRQNDEIDISSSIRIPPACMIKLKYGGEIIIISQCKEDRLDELIKKAKRENSERSPSSVLDAKINSENIMSRQQIISKEQTFQQDLATDWDIGKLNKTAISNPEIKKYVLDLLDRNSYFINGYSCRNFAKAKILYEFIANLRLRKRPNNADIQTPKTILDTKSANNIDFAVLYLALLHACDIEAEIQRHSDQIIVIFNADVKSTDMITANPRLYMVKAQKIYIPIRVNIDDLLFVRCWYQGAHLLNDKGKESGHE
jgi:ligand-binding sensor domain-containing protein